MELSNKQRETFIISPASCTCAPKIHIFAFIDLLQSYIFGNLVRLRKTSKCELTALRYSKHFSVGKYKKLGDEISPAGFRGSFSFSKAYLVLVASTIRQKSPKERLSTENWIQLLLSGISTAFSGTGLYPHLFTVWDFRLIKSQSVCLTRFPILAILNL